MVLIKRPLVLDNGEGHSVSKKKFTKRNGRDKMKKYSENGISIKQDGSEYVIGHQRVKIDLEMWAL